MRPQDFSEHEVLTRTIYGEARGERWCGKEAVALVILNRAANPGWWGKDVKGVCLAPAQFSCWNETDPNYPVLTSQHLPVGKPASECRAVARIALEGGLYDFTRGSCHYHTKAVSPSWSRGKTPILELDTHLFYNDVD